MAKIPFIDQVLLATADALQSRALQGQVAH